MRAWRQSQSEAALKRFVKRVPGQTLDRRLRALAAGALRRFGGVESLSKMLVSTTLAIREVRPSDPLPLQAAMTVMRLHEYVHSRQQDDDEAPNDSGYDGLNTDGIKAKIRQKLIDLVRKEPEIAIEAAQALGWVVIRPQSANGDCQLQP